MQTVVWLICQGLIMDEVNTLRDASAGCSVGACAVLGCSVQQSLVPFEEVGKQHLPCKGVKLGIRVRQGSWLWLVHSHTQVSKV